MNILIINHYAGSPDMGMEYRPYYLAKEWIKSGNKVKIVASSFSHVRTNQPIVKKSFKEENIDGIDYFWIKTPSYKGNSAKRFLNMLLFVDKLSHKAAYLAKTFKPDVVIASSTYPLDVFPAKRIAKKSNAKLIFEIHDLWPLSPMELGGYSKYHPFIKIMQIAENAAYKYSDKVISILPKTLEHTISHGLDRNKWQHVPNGIDLSEWENCEKIPDDLRIFINSKKESSGFSVAYAGTIGLANALDTFIDAAKKMLNDKINFFIIGKGPEKDRLLKRTIDEKIENVYFINPVPKTAIPDLLKYFDVLYVGLQKQPLFRFGISPNKIFDYMMSGRPVIQAIKAGNDLVSDASCGISIEPENSKEIVNAINSMKSKSKEDLENLGEKGKNFVLKNHTYNVLAEKFLNICNKLILNEPKPKI